MPLRTPYQEQHPNSPSSHNSGNNCYMNDFEREEFRLLVSFASSEIISESQRSWWACPCLQWSSSWWGRATASRRRPPCSPTSTTGQSSDSNSFFYFSVHLACVRIDRHLHLLLIFWGNTGCFFTLGLPLKVQSTKKLIWARLRVSRTIYVNVDSPIRLHLQVFHTFAFKGRPSVKKHPVCTLYRTISVPPKNLTFDYFQRFDHSGKGELTEKELYNVLKMQNHVDCTREEVCTLTWYI